MYVFINNNQTLSVKRDEFVAEPFCVEPTIHGVDGIAEYCGLLAVKLGDEYVLVTPDGRIYCEVERSTIKMPFNHDSVECIKNLDYSDDACLSPESWYSDVVIGRMIEYSRNILSACGFSMMESIHYLLEMAEIYVDLGDHDLEHVKHLIKAELTMRPLGIATIHEMFEHVL